MGRYLDWIKKNILNEKQPEKEGKREYAKIEEKKNEEKSKEKICIKLKFRDYPKVCVNL